MKWTDPRRQPTIDRITEVLAAHGFHIPPQTLNELANLVLDPPFPDPHLLRLTEEEIDFLLAEVDTQIPRPPVWEVLRKLRAYLARLQKENDEHGSR